MAGAQVRRIGDLSDPLLFSGLNSTFADVVAAHGDRPAIHDGPHTVTYAVLNQLADRHAAQLFAAGVKRGARIGVAIDRSIEAVVAMLAILRAGCAYVPFDPRAPADRIARQAADAGIALSCVSHPDDEAPGEKLVIDRNPAPGTFRPISPPSHPLEIAYVIYTSGSTGEPKGVEATHRGVANLILNAHYCRIRPDDVVFHGMSNAFDGATFEIWGALLNGAALAIAPPRFTVADAIDLAVRSGVTVMMLTTGLFNALRATDFARLGSVRVMLAGGDVMAPAAAHAFLRAGSGALVNGYGPTETTTFSHCHAMHSLGDAPAPIPIGRPIFGAAAHLIDDDAQPVTVGAAEIVVSGVGLAQGYLGKPARTAERFVPDPFGPPGSRLYLTGDLATCRDDVFDFVGRRDRQIKISGFRVEPGEIEHAILSQPGIAECCVLFEAGRLHAFCAPALPSSAMAELRGTLANMLPAYMVPSSLQSQDRLPLTTNGKVDREVLARRLHEPAPTLSGQASDIRHGEIVAAISDALQRHICVDDNLLELGFSSLEMIRLCAAVDRRFGVRLTLDVVMRSGTVADIADFVDTRAAGLRGMLNPSCSGVQDSVR